MPDLYAIGEDERKRLFERDAAVLARIRNLYGATLAEVNKEIAIVTGQLQALQRGEGDTRREPGLVAREIKAKQWLRNVEGRLAALAAPAAGLTAWHQGEASKLGQESIIRAGNRQLGHVATDWNKLQTEAMEAFAGFAGNGSPLKKVFQKIGPETAKDMEAVLFKGIGLGKNAIATGRELRQAAGLSSLRAQTIARTETIRAYRETQHLTLNENADVLEGWVWTASKSQRTCAACLALDGTFHKLSERMQGHPNCRCVAVPFTKGVEQVSGRKGLGETRVELGETGTEWFKKQPGETQDFILGPQGAGYYRKGEVKLENFVRKVRDPEWGNYFTRGSLKDALKGRDSHPGYDLPAIVKKKKRAPKGLPPANVAEPAVSIPTPAPSLPAGPIPGQFKSIAEAEAGMETLYPHIKFDFLGAHINAINPTTAEFHRLAQEWPEVVQSKLSYVGTYQNLDKLLASGHNKSLHKETFGGAFAHVAHGSTRMGLNHKRYNAPDLLQKEIEDCANNGWFAKGGKGIEYVMTHEFGHLVDFWLRRERSNWEFRNKAQISQGQTKIKFMDVSKYSQYDEYEAFAETFASLRYTPPVERSQYVKTMANVLEKAKAELKALTPPAPDPWLTDLFGK